MARRLRQVVPQVGYSVHKALDEEAREVVDAGHAGQAVDVLERCDPSGGKERQVAVPLGARHGRDDARCVVVESLAHRRSCS